MGYHQQSSDPGFGPLRSLVQSRAPAVHVALERVRMYAKIDRPVVFVGPVGAGKTTLARLLHHLSERPGPFVSISGGEASEELFRDLLFGHVPGAFTGARSGRKGVFERAAGGTVLIDDLAYLPREGQVALLRAVESRRFQPIGATREIPVTSREVYASTLELQEMVERDILIPDLRSRIGGFRIRVPGLSERSADLEGLALRFAKLFLDEHGREGDVEIANDALELLEAYGWPGNVREPRRAVERAVVHAGVHASRITLLPRHFPPSIREGSASRPGPVLNQAVAEAAVEAAGGNRSEAARRLGVHRNTLYRYLSGGH